MHMCSYRYRDGRCASGAVTDMVCVGEGSCPVHNPEAVAGETQPTRVISTEGEENLQAEWMRWNGLYCPKHNAFYCAAEGNCKSCDVTHDDYQTSLERYGKGKR